MTDLEIWLIGTPDAVSAATKALAHQGHPAQVSPLTRLAGKDTGRVSRYLRLQATTVTAKPRRNEKPATPTLLDSGEDT